MKRTIAGTLLAASVLAACGGNEQAPEVKFLATGIIVGRTLVADESGTHSVGGVVVSVRGTAARAISEQDKRFALTGIPLGEHEVVFDYLPDASGTPQFSRVVKTRIAAKGETVTLTDEEGTVRPAGTLLGKVTKGAATGNAGIVVFRVGGSQVTQAGDDGGFRLGGVSPGPARIGFQFQGFDAKVVDVTVTGGEQTIDAAVLQPGGAGTVALSGTAQLLQSTDHAGTVVLLDGGSDIVTTDAAGAWKLPGVSPGAHSLTFRHDGYRSVTLANVLVGTSGVDGLVPVVLGPGQDDRPATAAERNFTVRIIEPLDNAEFEHGAPVTLRAEVSITGENIPTERIVWTAALVESGTPGTPATLGRGRTISTSTLDIGMYQVTVSATTQGGDSLSDDKILRVVQRDPGLSVRVTSPLPGAEFFDDQQVVVAAAVSARAEEIPSDHIAWTLDGATDSLGTGRQVVLTGLTPGLHRPRVTACTLDAICLSDETTISIRHMEFTLERVSPPQAAASFFDTQAVELQVLARHSAETIPDDHVVWVSDTGFGASGARVHFDSLPVGVHHFTATARDSHNRSATTTFDVEVKPIVFTVVITKPVPTDTIYEGVPTRLLAQVSHSLRPVGNVRWVDDTGADLARGADTTTRLLAAGPRTLTATATDAPTGAQVSASVNVFVTALSFTAEIMEPMDGMVFTVDQPIVLKASTNHSVVQASAIEAQWWDDRSGQLDAGGLKADAPFTVPRQLAVGAHILTLRAIDPNGLLRQASVHVNIQGHWVAVDIQSPVNDTVYLADDTITFSATVTSDLPDPTIKWTSDGTEIGTGTSITPTLAAGDHIIRAEGRAVAADSSVFTYTVQRHVRVEAATTTTGTSGQETLIETPTTWAGTMYIRGTIKVMDGGSLTIFPGTKVVAERDAALQVYGTGVLTIGNDADSTPAVFAPRAGLETAGSWVGIYAAASSAISVRNAVFRYAQYALYVDAAARLDVTGVQVSDGQRGIRTSVPTTIRESTLRRCASGYWCVESYTSDLTVEDVLVEDSVYGIYVSGSTAGYVIRNTRLRRVGNAINANYGQRLDVENCTVEDSSAVGAEVSTMDAVRIVRTNFLRNAVAVNPADRHSGTSTIIRLNNFLGNTADVGTGAGSSTIDLAGNHFGAANDFTNAGYALYHNPAGIRTGIPKEPQPDSAALILPDNPLPEPVSATDSRPLSIIVEPKHMNTYTFGHPLDLVAWTESATDGATDGPTAKWSIDGTEVAEGFVAQTPAPAPGEHALKLTVTDASGRVFEHATRLVVGAAGRYAGPLTNDETVWSGEVLLTSDVIVPLGKTLRIEAGTRVRLGTDDARHWSEYDPEVVDARVGDRNLVGIYVRGAMHVDGTSDSPVVIEDEMGIHLPSRWDAIFVYPGAELTVENARIHGARVAVDAPIDGPSTSFGAVSLTDATFQGDGGAVQRACPMVYRRVAVDIHSPTAGYPVLLKCYQPFTMEDSSFSVGNQYAGQITGEMGSPLVSIRNTRWLNGPVETEGGNALELRSVNAQLEDVRFEGFQGASTAAVYYGSGTTLSIARAAFRRNTVAVNGDGDAVLDSVRFEDNGTDIYTSSPGFSVNRSSSSGAGVFYERYPTWSPQVLVVRESNLLTATLAHLADGNPCMQTDVFTFEGCWFGTADTAEIMARFPAMAYTWGNEYPVTCVADHARIETPASSALELTLP